jgi:2-methylaconitate cis-trans-isomerase PrpF
MYEGVLMQLRTKAVLYRGGTSKALIVHDRDLPTRDPALLDEWLLAAFGTPDRRQIDGIGGADMLTSKFAFVGPPSVPGADVDYTFAQVGVDVPFVDWTILCGNISSAIGPFAIEEGLVAATGELTEVRVHNTNTGKIFAAKVQTERGLPKTDGHAVVDGVPNAGAPIVLDFRNAAGAITGSLLPTGHRRDSRRVDGIGLVDYTVVDMTGLFVFVRADQFGLVASDDRESFARQAERLMVVDAFRGAVGQELGIDSPITPAVVLVGPTRPSEVQFDLHARCTGMGRVHSSFPITGSLATGAAASLAGSVVSDVAGGPMERCRIAHPSGVLSVEVLACGDDPEPTVHRAQVERTARRIFDGAISVDPARLSRPGAYRSSDNRNVD